MQPFNGPFLGTQNIGFHWAYQLSAFHLQLLPLEPSDVCCTCRLHLLLKAEVNICLVVSNRGQSAATQSCSTELTNRLRKAREKASVALNQHVILGKRSMSAQILVWLSKSLCLCLCSVRLQEGNVLKSLL